MLAQSIQCGEVEGGAEACSDDGGKSAAPKLAYRIRPMADVAESLEKGGGTGLLNAGFEEVDGLKERS